MSEELSITVAAGPGGEAVVSVSGELDIATGEELRDRLSQVLAHHGDVVVDLAGVTFLDCSGLRALLVPGLAISFLLSFVQSFAVFPSAVLVGAPAGPTRVISIAAYQAAFEKYDYSMASAIAMIMAAVQLVVVVVVLAGRNMFYRGSTSGGKG